MIHYMSTENISNKAKNAITEGASHIGVSSFGDRLQRYRKRSKVSAAKLADILNDVYGEGTISRDIINNIENGRRVDLSFERIIQLSYGLEISPIVLIVDLEQPFLGDTNPVFYGMQNYEIADLFMVSDGDVDKDPDGPMRKISLIRRALREYRRSTLTALERLGLYVNVITGEVTLEKLSTDWNMTVEQLDDGCVEDIGNIKTWMSALETLDVVITEEEENRYSNIKFMYAHDRYEAGDIGLIPNDPLHGLD